MLGSNYLMAARSETNCGDGIVIARNGDERRSGVHKR